MAYCPDCGGEIVDQEAYVCYHCGNQLREAPFEGEVDDEAFLAVITWMIDREIASTTSEIGVDVPEEVEQPYRLDEVTDQIRVHTIGYGKGFIESVLLGAEGGNDDVRYDAELYQSFFDWVGETVEQREAYIQAAIRDDPGGE